MQGIAPSLLLTFDLIAGDNRDASGSAAKECLHPRLPAPVAPQHLKHIVIKPLPSNGYGCFGNVFTLAEGMGL